MARVRTIDRGSIQRLSAHGTPTADGPPDSSDDVSLGTDADNQFLDVLKNGVGVVQSVQSIFGPKNESQPKPPAAAQPPAAGFGVTPIWIIGGAVVLVVLVFLLKRK